jgi:drug/metabolite transporter (DMT)-like permease
MQPQRSDLLILALGVVAVSTAALFIREADAPSMIIAAYRLALASLPLLAVSGVSKLRGHHDASVDTRHAGGLSNRTKVLLTLAAGVFLALHFGFWVASVKQTSIVTSVVLVTSQPLLVGVAAIPLLHERMSRETWIGVSIAITGAIVMVASDAGSGSSTLLGDLYAVLGAIFAASYLLSGRSLRTSGVGWLPYVTSVYSVAAVLLLIAAAVAGDAFTGYTARTWGFMVLLALVPQLIGHTALNRSLGYLPAVAVTIAVLGEPVGATILAVLFLDETPTLLQAIGALMVLAGVYAGLRGTFGKAAEVIEEAPETL